MKPEAQRIAIAEWYGFTGCTDSLCDYRKAQHLHKDSQVYFPEPYSIPMYPDYLRDLNAMHEAEGKLDADQLQYTYSHQLYNVVVPKSMQPFRATAAQRAEALLRTIGKWVEE